MLKEPTIDEKLLSSRIMSLTSLDACVPDRMAIPTLARFSDGISFVPSPTTATISPRR